MRLHSNTRRKVRKAALVALFIVLVGCILSLIATIFVRVYCLYAVTNCFQRYTDMLDFLLWLEAFVVLLSACLVVWLIVTGKKTYRPSLG